MADAVPIESLPALLLMQGEGAKDPAPSAALESLIAQAQTGDAAAFDRLMLLEQARVFRVSRSLLAHPNDAADAAQETFLRLYRHLDKFDAARRWDSWVYRIAVNVCRDLNRRRGWRRLLSLDAWLESGGEPASPRPTPLEALTQDEHRYLLARALRRLPQGERTAVVLRDVEGLSAAEAAKTLGVAETTVRSQASRGRKRLKEWLE